MLYNYESHKIWEKQLTSNMAGKNQLGFIQSKNLFTKIAWRGIDVHRFPWRETTLWFLVSFLSDLYKNGVYEQRIGSQRADSFSFKRRALLLREPKHLWQGCLSCKCINSLRKIDTLASFSWYFWKGTTVAFRVCKSPHE